MNKQQAKEILTVHMRCPEGDPPDGMEEALAMAESDPELREWLQLQAELDPVLEEALSNTPVPPDLEETLLETVRTSPVVRKVAWYRQARIAGVAAAMVLGIGGSLFLRSNESIVQTLQESITGTSPDDFSHFRGGMAYYIRNVYFQLDHLTEDLDSIESWLDNSRAPGFEDLPAPLTALVPLGCKELKWQGLDVALVCFHTRDGKIVHLFLLDQDKVDPGQINDITRVAVSSGLETGGWLSGDTVYLLVGFDPEVDIEFVLNS